MIGLGTLERMSKDDLRGWLLQRMRGGKADPPIAAAQTEAPDDYVAVIHERAMDPGFRARLEAVITEALGEVARGDLRGGRDAIALKNLVELVDRRELRGALPLLEKIAEGGIFGGREGQIEPRAEEAVLFALAGLQNPKVLWGAWARLWQQEDAALWPTAIVGLRISNPDRAAAMLPEIVQRALSTRKVPLGEILWGFGTDPSLESEQIAKALDSLSRAELRACRRELEEVGATEEEIERWLPAVSPRVLPVWAQREHQVLPSSPPRLQP